MVSAVIKDTIQQAHILTLAQQLYAANIFSQGIGAATMKTGVQSAEEKVEAEHSAHAMSSFWTGSSAPTKNEEDINDTSSTPTLIN